MSKPRRPSQPAAPDAFQSIDPTALAHVSGGASRTPAAAASTGAESSVAQALTGILDSLKDLASQPQQGFGPTEMMMFMMLMAGRQQGPSVAAPQGVTINGQWYPFR